MFPTWLHCDKNAATITMPAPKNINNEDPLLMERIAEGNETALRQLIEKWQSPLINFFYRSTQSREESEDLAQTVFIKIYQAAPRYKPLAKFSTYLFHIARRQLINHYRSSKRKPLNFVDPTELYSHSVNDNITTIDIEEAFNNAVSSLPEKQKTAILLLKQQELSYAEIAEAMKASVSAVKSWIYRARQTLKEKLEDSYSSIPL